MTQEVIKYPGTKQENKEEMLRKFSDSIMENFKFSGKLARFATTPVNDPYGVVEWVDHVNVIAYVSDNESGNDDTLKIERIKDAVHQVKNLPTRTNIPNKDLKDEFYRSVRLYGDTTFTINKPDNENFLTSEIPQLNAIGNRNRPDDTFIFIEYLSSADKSAYSLLTQEEFVSVKDAIIDSIKRATK